MEIISSKDVYNIIRKALGIVNPMIMNHQEVVAYILYKMLQSEKTYTQKELIDYTMAALLHDIGIYKTAQTIKTSEELVDFEINGVWSHSVYGYLFLRHLSPMGEKAEIVLYHHLYYKRLGYISCKYTKIIEYLRFADTMDAFMKSEDKMSQDYFVKNRDQKFSARAMECFIKIEEKEHITENLIDGSYKEELTKLLESAVLSENEKRKWLQMLVYIIDFRSEHTVIHTLATTVFATEIGHRMRLGNIDIQKLYYGALLHDIGKIAIPVSILEAPRKLTDSEMRIMRAHVAITEKILTGVINEEVLEIAIRHHEKLDGSGYHKGLNGDDLSLLQRIAAVADIISALYGKRSYKDSFDLELIKKILKEDADNGKICPKVVEVALHNFESLIEKYEREKEHVMGTYMTIKDEFVVIMERFKGL